MHTTANSKDKGGDIGVRQLWSGSWHYSEENKDTNIPAASPSSPHPHFSQLNSAEAPRTTEVHRSASGCRGSTGISGARTPSSHSGGAQRLRQPVQTGDIHLPRKSSTARKWNWAKENKMLLSYLLENKRKTSLYQPAAEFIPLDTQEEK